MKTPVFWIGLIAAFAAVAFAFFIIRTSGAGNADREHAPAQADEAVKRAGATVTPTTPPLKIEPK